MRRSQGSSPLTRGKRVPPQRHGEAEGLIPAHAGKTVAVGASITSPWAHPRSRGENLLDPIWLNACEGSSPLTRGKPRAPCRSLSRPGLIPAHAGKTHRCVWASLRPGAHPRSRGENSTPSPARALQAGSSPLTRGKHLRLLRVRGHAGLIPAHAGKTLRKVLQRQHLGAHPRSRGENSGQGM